MTAHAPVWQTHIPLAAATLNKPFKVDCQVLPATQGRIDLQMQGQQYTNNLLI